MTGIEHGETQLLSAINETARWIVIAPAQVPPP